jgi:GT2 family glycosyltransferase
VGPPDAPRRATDDARPTFATLSTGAYREPRPRAITSRIFTSASCRANSVAKAASGARTEGASVVSGVVPKDNSARLLGETSAKGKQPLVFIIVLNWNGLADTIECLRSLSLLEYENKRVVVVDNGSNGKEAFRIETTVPAVTVIRNRENLGYTGGNNVGIRYALTNGADYVWLLNNDTTVPADCLTKLIDAGEKHGRVGLLSPLIYGYAPPHAIEFAGAVLPPRSEEQCTLTLGEASEAARESDPVLVWGTALLLKRQVADIVGLLDERYFAYHEDIDYCLRAVAAGFETLVVREAGLYHKRGRSLGSERSPIKEYLQVRNWYLLRTTRLSGWRRWTYPCQYLAWVLSRVLNARQVKRDTAVDYALDGAWDALRGHWGSWEMKGHMPRSLRALLLNGLLAWHPYFSIMVIGGDLAGVWSHVTRRILRNPASADKP